MSAIYLLCKNNTTVQLVSAILLVLKMPRYLVLDKFIPNSLYHVKGIKIIGLFNFNFFFFSGLRSCHLSPNPPQGRGKLTISTL